MGAGHSWSCDNTSCAGCEQEASCCNTDDHGKNQLLIVASLPSDAECDLYPERDPYVEHEMDSATWQKEQTNVQDSVRQFALLAKQGIECEFVCRRGYSPAIFKIDQNPERILVERKQGPGREVPFVDLSGIYRYEEVMDLMHEDACSFLKDCLKNKKVKEEDWKRILVFIYPTGLGHDAICLVIPNNGARERFVTCMKILLLSVKTFQSGHVSQAALREATPEQL